MSFPKPVKQKIEQANKYRSMAETALQQGRRQTAHAYFRAERILYTDVAQNYKQHRKNMEKRINNSRRRQMSLMEEILW